MKSIYKIITKEKQLWQLIRYCKKTGYASVDFETTTRDDEGAFCDPEGYPTIMGCSFQPGSGWVLPLGHFDSPFKKADKWVKLLQIFGREVMEDPNIVKIAHNASFEMKWFKRFGIIPKGYWFDTILAKYLLDEERPHGLKEQVGRFLPDFDGYEDYEGSKLPWNKKPLGGLSKYCALDCDSTLRLWLYFEPKLMEFGFYPLFRNLLMMNLRVLSESEYTGMIVNRDYLKNLVDTYSKKIEDSEKGLYDLKVIRKYNDKKVKKAKKQLIKEVKQEIKALKREEKEEDVDNSRKIKSREDKVSRYIAGEFTTKKERNAVSELNLGSPAQLKELLYYNKHGFKFTEVKEKNKKKEWVVSTAESALLKIQKSGEDTHGFVKRMLEHRGLSKLYSTNIKGMYDILGEDNRLHTSYKIFGTVTGRLSSVEPNLQNIPRATTNSDIKPMFRPPKGMLMVEFDYSQAEMRVVAEMSKDKNLIDAFASGLSLHVYTATRAEFPNLTGDALYKKYEEVYAMTKDEDHKDHIFWTKRKKRAKTIGFGILYGQSDKMLAETIGCSEEEAGQFKKDWFKAYPKVEKWIKGQHKKAKKHGYVRTLFGRKRRLPNIYSDIIGIRSEAERQSVNAPIQGTSSDYTQFSSILVREKRLQGEFPAYFQQCYTVHDSLGYYVKPKDIHKLVGPMVKICSNPQTKKWFGFQAKHVNMKVSCELGPTWGNYHDYDKDTDYVELTKKWEMELYGETWVEDYD